MLYIFYLDKISFQSNQAIGEYDIQPLQACFFCSCDLDLNMMTLIYKICLDIPKMYLCTVPKINFLGQGFLKLDYYRQRHRQMLFYRIYYDAAFACVFGYSFFHCLAWLSLSVLMKRRWLDELFFYHKTPQGIFRLCTVSISDEAGHRRLTALSASVSNSHTYSKSYVGGCQTCYLPFISVCFYVSLLLPDFPQTSTDC